MYGLRKRVKIVLWIVVIGFVAWVFFELGADIVGKRVAKPWERGIIAEIDHTPVLYQVYNALYQQMYQDSVKAKGGRDLTDQEEIALEREAWNQVIREVRWSEILKKRPFKFSDEFYLALLQVSPPKELLQDSTFLDSQGQFDIQKYRAALANPQNLPYFANYERKLRHDIPRDLTRTDVALSVSVPETWAREQYKLQNTRVTIREVQVNPAAIPDSELTYTEEDLRRYFQEHLDRYRAKERVNLQFVQFPKLPSEEDVQEALDRAKTALEEIKSGTPPEEVARYYSDDDYTRKTGGDLGWVPLQQVPADVRPVIDTLPTGRFSEPFRTRRGWEIVRVLERKGDSLHVWRITVAVRTSGQTKERARQKAEDFLNLAKEVGFDSAAKALGVQVSETRPFPREFEFVPLLGGDPEVVEFAHKAKVGEISPLIRRARDYLVLRVKEVLPPETPEWDKVKETVKRDYLNELRRQRAMAIAREIYEALKQGTFNADSVKARYGALVTVYDSVTLHGIRQAAPGIPVTVPLHYALFLAPEGSVLPPTEVARKIFVVQILHREEPSEEEVAQAAARLRQQLQFRYTNDFWSAWQKDLTRAKSIKDYRKYMLY